MEELTFFKPFPPLSNSTVVAKFHLHQSFSPAAFTDVDYTGIWTDQSKTVHVRIKAILALLLDSTVDIILSTIYQKSLVDKRKVCYCIINKI